MKVLVRFIIICAALILGFKLNAVQTQAQAPISAGDLKIVNAVTQVKHGGIGVITIQGRPGTIYTVRSSFRTGNDTLYVKQWRTANKSGQATFIWHVSQYTVPGSYAVTISGDGKTLKLNHNVIQ